MKNKINKIESLKMKWFFQNK